MPESATPGEVGDFASSGAGAALTPEAIDAILTDFRAWLAQLAPPAVEPLPPPAESIDLHTLVAQFAALRHEVNLQTRAVRGQQEQNAETLKQNDQLFQSLEAATEQVAAAQQQAHADDLRPLLKGMIDAADAQLLAAKEMQRLVQQVDEVLACEAEVEKLAAEPMPRLPFLARLFGTGQLLAEQRRCLQLRDSAGLPTKPAEAIRQRVHAAAAGLAMGSQRIERAMAQVGLTPISAEGRLFDPEMMEAVEVVLDTGRAAGEVVEEVRRGFLWNDRVFRVAQVRVAK